MRLLRIPGVFKPPSDSYLLAGAMRERGLAEGARVLDVFTGSGVLAVAAALAGAREVWAVDISRRAALAARLNGALNGRRVRAVAGDLFAPVRGERFDLITANPPYVPGADNELPADGLSRAWEGGMDGRLLVDRLCAEAGSHLAPGGTLLMVHSSLTGERPTIEALAAADLDPEVLVRDRGPLGPLVSARADLLEQRGLLAPGEREEEMLVIAGRAA
jgi:release factor glutamine methyltransferase